MRLFYALWPDDTTRIQLAQRRNDVVRLSGGRPSTPDSLHMTLVYIGEVPDTRFDEVCAIGDRMVHAGFDYPVDTTACFDSAKVGWLGAAEPPLGLFSLQMHLRIAINSAGFTIDKRRFRPHITVARDIEQPFDAIAIEPVMWRANSFSLVHSMIADDGVHHEVLRDWPLRASIAR